MTQRISPREKLKSKFFNIHTLFPHCIVGGKSSSPSPSVPPFTEYLYSLLAYNFGTFVIQGLKGGRRGFISLLIGLLKLKWILELFDFLGLLHPRPFSFPFPPQMVDFLTTLKILELSVCFRCFPSLFFYVEK